MDTQIKASVADNIINPHYIPLFDSKFPLILLWTPKSACTTLNNWFFYQKGLLEEVKQIRSGDVHSYRENDFRKEPSYSSILKQELIYGNKKIIKFVRNPYKRAVSSYLNTIAADWLFANFNRPIEIGLSFKEFLLKLKEMGPLFSQIDKHIGPQYIDGEENLKIDYVKIENLSVELKRIEKIFRLKNVSLNQLSHTSFRFSSKMKLTGDYANTVLNANVFDGDLPTYDSFYDYETQKLVEELFSLDFSMYGYKKW